MLLLGMCSSGTVPLYSQVLVNLISYFQFKLLIDLSKIYVLISVQQYGL